MSAKEKYKEEVLAYKQKAAAEKNIRAKARAVALQERERQAIKTAQYKEQQRGKAARTVSKSGNGLAKFGAVAEAFTGKPSKAKKNPLDGFKI